MHRHEDNANWQDFTVPLSLSKLADCANITGCSKKECKCGQKISEKSHFEIRQYAMLPTGGAIKLKSFCMGAH